MTSVYGPQEDEDKVQFLEELLHVGEGIQLPWIVNGDFNLVINADERSTGRINRRMANKF